MSETRAARLRTERQCRALFMFHKDKTKHRVCFWRRLRKRYAPNLPHQKMVWRRVVDAQQWPRTAR